MPAVLSDDSLNRYRITHPDKDIRALCRRINRLTQAGSSSTNKSSSRSAINSMGENETGNPEEEEGDADMEREREMTRIEALKWKITIERLMASARNLGRQGERYRLRAEETSRQAEALEATLEDEKRELATKLNERDHMIRCDEVYAKITARPKTKEELNDQIITLRVQIEAHRASHATYLEIVQRRIDAFSAITPILDNVKTMKLPVETSTDIPDESMDIDDPPSSSSREEEPSSESGTKLSVMALPFQPSQTAVPAAPSRHQQPAPPTAPSRAASHALPHRPSRLSPSVPTAPSAPRSSGAGPASRAASASLPQRPSALRSSVTPGRNMLEEGEVEGEDGEVDVRKAGRGARRRM